MNYLDGTYIRIGDIIRLPDGQTGEIVSSIDTGHFSKGYPKKDWSMFDSGILVKIKDGGVVHIEGNGESIEFIEHPERKSKLRQWLEKPVLPGDRLTSTLLGIWAGMWIGGIGRVVFETPVGFVEVGKFVIVGAILGATFGAVFPKVSRFVTAPFAFFGFGNGGT